MTTEKAKSFVKRHRLVLSVLLAVLLVWFFGGVEALQKCVEQTTRDHDQNYFTIYRLFVRSYTGCVVGFAEDHDSIILGVGTLALAVFTYRLWRSTQTLAVDAEKASRDTIAQMQKAEQRQLRAYVFLDRIVCLKPNVTYPQMSQYRIIVKNSGQTPAHEVRTLAAHSYGPIGLKGRIPIPEPSEDATRDIIPAGGQLVTEIPDFALAPNETAAILAGKATIYLHGTILYRDVFGNEHYSNFRHYRLPNSHAFGGSPDGNDAS